MEEALSRLKTINLANIKSAKDLGLQIGYTDEQFLNFAQQADLSGDVLQQYKDYISASSAATSAFGTTLKSIAANMGIMLAVSVGINLLMKAVDALVVTEKEVLEAADSAKNKITELNQTYEASRKKVGDYAKTYDKLSKGIDNSIIRI